ncbi:hypothetical protein ACFVH7_12250 [Kitasatospora indigofera]|uniref:hypothetical protein n=1 Tax=Kitasatospora indigofera TaxID=67307 RepID=UPI00363D22F8
MPDPTEVLDAIEKAARGIQAAIDDWDAVNDDFCEEGGYIVDAAGWDARIVERDMAAWNHFRVVLEHGTAFVLAGRQACKTLPQGDITARLPHDLRVLSETYGSAHKTIQGWPADEVAAGPAERATEELAAEVWHEMSTWAAHVPGVATAIKHEGAAIPSAARLRSPARPAPPELRPPGSVVAPTPATARLPANPSSRKPL